MFPFVLPDSQALVMGPSVFQTPCDAGTVGSTSPYATNMTDTDAAISLSRGLEGGTSEGFSFLNLTAGDPAFALAGGNMTQYLLDTYARLSHTRRAATTFEDPVNPVTAFSALLEAGQGPCHADAEERARRKTRPRLARAVCSLSVLCAFLLLVPLHVARAWFDNRHYHSLPASMHMINNAILQAETRSAGRSYTATILNYPLNSTADEKTQVRWVCRKAWPAALRPDLALMIFHHPLLLYPLLGILGIWHRSQRGHQRHSCAELCAGLLCRISHLRAGVER